MTKLVHSREWWEGKEMNEEQLGNQPARPSNHHMAHYLPEMVLVAETALPLGQPQWQL
jgi:hypothetical protein